jgi:predicted O-methyltransferase YrrM
VLAGLLRDGYVTARLDGTRHALEPVAIGRAEGEAARDWVIRVGASRTIDVGLGYGLASLFICEGLLANGDPAARHVAIDPNQRTRFANAGLQSLEDAGLADMLDYHAEESQIVLPRFVAEGRSFDLAFLDANHRFDHVFPDLVYLGRLVRPGGIVFTDDHQLTAVRRAVSFCVTNLGWTLEETSESDDLHHRAVLRTSATADTRPFDHFVEF